MGGASIWLKSSRNSLLGGPGLRLKVMGGMGRWGGARDLLNLKDDRWELRQLPIALVWRNVLKLFTFLTVTMMLVSMSSSLVRRQNVLPGYFYHGDLSFTNS